MRDMYYGEAEVITEDGGQLTCEYRILIRDLPPPVGCESYGIGIRLVETGEWEEVHDLTVQPSRIEGLAGLLHGGGVTPCALRDVVLDWL